MTTRWIMVSGLAVLLPLALSPAEGPADAKAAIANATKALGAENLRTIEFSGSGYDFVLGQAPNPSSPWPKFNDKTYTRVIDLEAPASRMERVRTQAENPPRGGGQQPIVGEQRQTQVVSVGSPQAAMLPDELMMTVPYSFLRSAAARNLRRRLRQSAAGNSPWCLSPR